VTPPTKRRTAVMTAVHMETRVGVTSFSTEWDREIVATRIVDAPLRVVWEAWTNPECLSRWMTGPEGWTMPVCEVDPCTGGEWHFVWRGPDGQEIEMRGVYREVSPPERLAYTEWWGDGWPPTLNVLCFTESEGRTTIVHTLLFDTKEARDSSLEAGVADGWSESYGILDDHLRTMA
jgi:uncharacterized protein YndB with AHSA1/START domain